MSTFYPLANAHADTGNTANGFQPPEPLTFHPTLELRSRRDLKPLVAAGLSVLALVLALLAYRRTR